MSGRQWVRSAPSGPLGALGGGMAGEGPLSTEGKACGCHGALTTRGGMETWGFTAAAAFPEWTGQPSASTQGLPGRRALCPLSQQNSHGPSCSFQMEEFHLMHQSPGMAGRGVGEPWDGRSAWVMGALEERPCYASRCSSFRLPPGPPKDLRPLTRKGHQQTPLATAPALS